MYNNPLDKHSKLNIHKKFIWRSGHYANVSGMFNIDHVFTGNKHSKYEETNKNLPEKEGICIVCI